MFAMDQIATRFSNHNQCLSTGVFLTPRFLRGFPCAGSAEFIGKGNSIGPPVLYMLDRRSGPPQHQKKIAGSPRANDES